MECGDFTLILQSGEKRAKIDLSQFTEEKPEPRVRTFSWTI